MRGEGVTTLRLRITREHLSQIDVRGLPPAARQASRTVRNWYTPITRVTGADNTQTMGIGLELERRPVAPIAGGPPGFGAIEEPAEEIVATAVIITWRDTGTGEPGSGREVGLRLALVTPQVVALSPQDERGGETIEIGTGEEGARTSTDPRSGAAERGARR